MTDRSDDASRAAWQRAHDEAETRRDRFTTLSFEEVPALGLPEDGDIDPAVGYPGAFPYTRGIHATGYRGKLWTIRQFAGFGSVEATNERFRFLHLPRIEGFKAGALAAALRASDRDADVIAVVE